jgi:hypothetical protein
MNEQVKALIEQGVPVYAAMFVHAVDSEQSFSTASHVGSRRAEMWLTSLGLVCLKRDTRQVGGVAKKEQEPAQVLQVNPQVVIIPLANVSYCRIFATPDAEVNDDG